VRYWRAWWYVSSGHLALAQDDLNTAQQNYEAALTLAQEGQMVSVERWVLTNLGHLLAMQGKITEAEQYYQSALTIQRAAGLVMNITDAMAGMAELFLLRQEFTAAQAQVEEILASFDRYGLLVAEAPSQVYQTCYRVLTANADPRAIGVLQQAYDRLLQQAENLQEAVIRRSFLENVTVNRKLIATAQAAGLTKKVCYPLSAPANRPRIKSLPRAR
jgi:tetratricopeptide (TPR) repeat protein